MSQTPVVMTPILTHLHQHFPADWKQAPPLGTVLHFWYQAPDLAAYLEIGDERLYVRWFDGENPKGQYGGGGVDLTVTPTRAALDKAIPAAVAQAAVGLARQGLPVPAIPAWAQKAYRLEQARRLRELAALEADLRDDLRRTVKERAYLTELEVAAATADLHAERAAAESASEPTP